MEAELVVAVAVAASVEARAVEETAVDLVVAVKAVVA